MYCNFECLFCLCTRTFVWLTVKFTNICGYSTAHTVPCGMLYDNDASRFIPKAVQNNALHVELVTITVIYRGSRQNLYEMKPIPNNLGAEIWHKVTVHFYLQGAVIFRILGIRHAVHFILLAVQYTTPAVHSVASTFFCSHTTTG